MIFTIEQESIIKSKNRINVISGVPGCGKTTTLYGRINYLKDSNILVITRTNSVVEEIRNHGIKYNVIFNKLNNSGHLIHSKNNNKYIGIANIDSFIHYQLDIYGKSINSNILNEIKDNFLKKKQIFFELIKKGNIKNLYLKTQNGKVEINEICIDEVQDMIPIELESFIYILRFNTELFCSVFGDTLQTLTEESTEKYPIINLLKYLPCKLFKLSSCFRCQPEHINFNNELFRKIIETKKYGDLPIMITNKKTNGHKPFLFSHPGMNQNNNGYKIAEILICIISNIIENDPEITFGDISILVPKINDCNSIPILIDRLINKFGNHFYYFETKQASKTIPIDFNNIKEIYCNCVLKTNNLKKKKFKVNSNYCSDCKTKRKIIKTSIISIDAFKGKESKVIISLNLSDKSIPRENHIDKKEELTDYSKLNVITTRSTKYYFQGINELSPSRYFIYNKKKLENLYYHPWFYSQFLKSTTFYSQKYLEKHNLLFKNSPKIYKLIAESDPISKNKEPISIDFNSKNTPNNNTINLTDISDNLNIDDFCKYKIETEIYGKFCQFENQYDSRIIGNMGNLIVMRNLWLHNRLNKDYNNILLILTKFLEDENIYIIDSEQIYSIIVDNEINNTYGNIIEDNFIKPKYFEKIEIINNQISKSKINNKNLYTKQISYNILSKYKLKIFTLQSYITIRNDIRIFLNKSKNNKDIDSKIYFNISILLDHLLSNIYRPINKNYINIFNKNLDLLHDNSLKFILHIDNCILEKIISFNYIEKNSNIIDKMGFDIIRDNRVYFEGYKCNIIGKTDIISNNYDLFEIKTSNSEICNKKWVFQVFLYYIFNSIKNNEQFTNIYIVNILRGIIYKISFFDILQEKQIIDIILNKYKFIKDLKENFINEIFKKRV